MFNKTNDNLKQSRSHTHNAVQTVNANQENERIKRKMYDDNHADHFFL